MLTNCYRLDELLALGNPGRDKSNTPFWDSNSLVDNKLKTLLLLAEHNTQNLALVLNRLHNHIEGRLLERFLPLAARMTNCSELLETITSSVAFKQKFYHQVTGSGLDTTAGSFQKFYLRFLQGCNCSKESGQTLLTILSKAPYNAAFGLYLCSDYETNMSEFRQLQSEKLLHQCGQNLETFDLWCLFGTKITADALAVLQKAPKECSEFVSAIKSKEKSLGKIPDKIASLHQSLLKGDVKGLQKTKIPREAFHLVTGFDSPMSVHVSAQGEKHDLPIETKKMNLVELACSFGHAKIAKFFLKDLNMVSHIDLQSER